MNFIFRALARATGLLQPIETGGEQLHCIKCRYNLQGLPATARCPECGRPVLSSAMTAARLVTEDVVGRSKTARHSVSRSQFCYKSPRISDGEVGPEQAIVLHEAVGNGDAALYAATLQLDNAPASGLAAFLLSRIRNADGADPVNVFYDPSQPANAYLTDQTYALGNGGELAPATWAATPEPVGLSYLAIGAGSLLQRPRRRRDRR